jgi:hypothetical protein
MWTRNAHYALMNAMLLMNCGALLAGGITLWAGFASALMLSTMVDEAAGDDVARDPNAPVRFLDAMLFLTLPLMTLNIIALSLLFGTGDGFGLVPFLLKVGIDVEAARSASGLWTLLGALMGTGLFVGAAATNVAHELTHRTQDRAAMLAGRWLLAFSFDTSFSIEHVYGHHRNVGTPSDPATARRGEYSLAFFLRSTMDGNLSAWRIETARLLRGKLPVFSLQNRFLTGQLMSLTILAAVTVIGGTFAALAFFAVAVQGKLYLELVNYIEHYGLVRVPGKAVQPRHSWNTYKALSAGLLYNLPRHSHHHMYAAKPFWALEAEPDGPTYPFGYMTMILISLAPPLWRKVVDPLLANWDRDMASDGERAILAPQSGRSPPNQVLPAE